MARITLARSAVVVACALGAQSAYAQTDEDRAAARAAATEGATAMEQGRYSDAIDLFARAESLVHAPPHLLYMARANEKIGKLVRAQEAYLKITRETLPPNAPRAFADARAAADAELAALQRRIPTVKVHIEDDGDDVVLTMDGVEVPRALHDISRPVDPGSHVFVAKGKNRECDPVTKTVAEGSQESVDLTLKATAVAAVAPPPVAHPPPPPPQKKGSSALRTGAFIGWGVGVVGVAVGTIFMLKNRSARDDADALCPNGHCLASQRSQVESLDSDANSAATLSWIGYGVGIAGLAAGTAMFVMSSGSEKPAKSQASVELHPVLGLNRVGLAGSF